MRGNQARVSVRRKTRTPRASSRLANSSSPNDSEYSASPEPELEPVPDEAAPATKRRKIASRKSSTTDTYRQLLATTQSPSKADTDRNPSLPPSRKHTLAYHKPLLLDGDIGRQSRAHFLQWFDSVSLARAMPWRKTWVDPRSYSDPLELRSVLERRAYEVWISEIMLQQTRVAAVIEYWNRWMAKWPTIQDLAAASHDDVLAAWRGLGYYSRATRIHEAAKSVVNDDQLSGLLPQTAAELEAKVAGVGRYTAGAISSIVFGRPEPMVDGNVLRVLSRQLGIYGNIKTDKKVIDMIWAAAEALVKAVADDPPDDQEAAAQRNENSHVLSDRPGRWGQGLMELGSTICTPKPNCADCPLTSTCRAYNEGIALGKKGTKTEHPAVAVDMEDLCTVCEPFKETLEGITETATPEPPPAKKSAKQTTLAAFAFTNKSAVKNTTAQKDKTENNIELAIDHARKFPIKVIKKAVREEETLVCAIRRSSDGRYLIHRRPDKGLLAGLWEFPSLILQDAETMSRTDRKKAAQAHANFLVDEAKGSGRLTYVGDLGSVPWLFSHIKLTMHVHFFTLADSSTTVQAISKGTGQDKWSDDVEAESMGTGMRKCWDLVRDALT